MEILFIKLLNMSYTAGYLILAVILFRFLFKKAPKWINCALWGLAGLRLALPFSLESVLSLIPPDYEPFSPALVSNGANTISGEIINNPAPIITDIPAVTQNFDTEEIMAFILSAVWIVGIIALTVYALVSYIKIRRQVCEAAKIRDNIFECDRIDTPFILGIIKPKIYLPSTLNKSDMEYVLLHETAHLKRKDYIWKPLGFLLLTVYWFNPIIWIAYILLCKDIELACDEKVIKEMGAEIKKSYSSALVNCSTQQRIITACPLAFGETSVKTRVKNVLSYKKPAFWIIIAAVVASIVTAVCFMTDPIGSNNSKNDNTNPSFIVTNTGSDIDGISISVKEFKYTSDENEITVEWKNDTDKEFYFPESFDIQYYKNGDIISCAKEKLVFDAIANILTPEQTIDKVYDISSFDLHESGKYRFKVELSDGKYVWADFVKSDESFTAVAEENPNTASTANIYKYGRILYINDTLSYGYAAPESFYVTPDMDLVISENGSNVNKGNLEEIKLTKANFDNYAPGEWDKSSASGIRKSADKTYRVITADKNNFYYLLFLDNGDTVLTYGYLDSADKTRSSLYGAYLYLNGGTENVLKTVEKPRNPFCITATVLDVRENSILVNEYGKERGEIDVSLDKLKNTPDLTVGDKIKIYYTGGIMESYPGQINSVKKIEVLESGVSIYTYSESPEPVKPRIELHPDYNFVFIDSYLSSKFAYTGKYEVSQSELRLKTSDGKIFAFKNSGDETFAFDAERSAELQKYKYSENSEFELPVPDGAVFKIKK